MMADFPWILHHLSQRVGVLLHIVLIPGGLQTTWKGSGKLKMGSDVPVLKNGMSLLFLFVARTSVMTIPNLRV